MYSIEGTEYSLYEAASGDWCVTVSRYGEKHEDYNLGDYAKALEFILNDYRVEE